MNGNQTSPPVTVMLESGPTGAGTIDDFELFYARRALDRFRAGLGRQGLLDLLATDIEEGNAFLRESALSSDGTFKAGTTVLATHGLTSGAFLAWVTPPPPKGGGFSLCRVGVATDQPGP